MPDDAMRAIYIPVEPSMQFFAELVVGAGQLQRLWARTNEAVRQGRMTPDEQLRRLRHSLDYHLALIDLPALPVRFSDRGS